MGLGFRVWGLGTYIGIMGNKMETTLVYWGYIGIIMKIKWKLLWYIGVILGLMENKMETTIYIGVILR